MAGSHELLVTIEENAVMGGAGSAVGEFLASEGLEVPLLQLGLPDYYVEHAKPSEMLAECGLMPRASKRQYASVSTGSSAKPSNNGG